MLKAKPRKQTREAKGKESKQPYFNVSSTYEGGVFLSPVRGYKYVAPHGAINIPPLKGLRAQISSPLMSNSRYLFVVNFCRYALRQVSSGGAEGLSKNAAIISLAHALLKPGPCPTPGISFK